MLRGREREVCHLDRPAVVVEQEVRPRELAVERDQDRVAREVRELTASRLEDGDRLGVAVGEVEGEAERGDGSGDRRAIAQLAAQLDGRAQMPLGGVVAARRPTPARRRAGRARRDPTARR